MAKIKVHELAKELDKPSKDILSFLKNKGIDAKVAQSTIDDDAVTMVKKEFGAPVVKTANASRPDSVSAVPVRKEETASSANSNPGMSARPKEEPKKRKNMIFINNPQNSNISGQRSGNGKQRSGGQGGQGGQSHGGNSGGNRSFNGGRGQGGRMQEAPHKLIKPLTPPSAPESFQPERKTANPPHRTPAPAVSNQDIRGGEDKLNVNKRQDARTHAELSAAGRGDDKRVETVAAGAAQVRNTLPESGRTAPAQTEGVRAVEPRVPDVHVPAARSNVPRSNDNRTGGARTDDRRGREYRGGENRGQTQENRRSSPGGSGQRYSRDGGPGQGQNQNQYQNQNRNRSGNQDVRTDRGERTYQQRSTAPGERPSRPDGGRRPDGANRPGGGGYQGDRRNAPHQAAGNRPGGSDGRFDKGNERPDNRFSRQPAGKSSVPEGMAKDNAKHREEEKRRISQEKDKRSKKDFVYEDSRAKTGGKAGTGKVSTKRKVGAFIKPEKRAAEVQEEQIKVIILPEVLTIKMLADKMKIQPSAIIKKLFLQGQIVNVNSEISYEDAENIAIEYEIMCEQEVKIDIIEELLKEEEEVAEELIKRAPIICVMGHVDHGKTSLLDAVRKTHVTERESGGITQHIGAYTVTIHDQKITFLDTPGHEAFTAMRMRGATATDIAILVVAADDGVMPQTVEAISHAKAAGIEIIVAVNKVDKPSANIDRVKQEMTEFELIPTDWGGTTEYVPVSAKTGEGIDTLLETILLTAEIMELKANPNRQGRGLVIEAELDKGRGPVATVLVQKGTLHVGDFISAGACHGKVRAMVDDKGRRVKEAIPSTPVEILGLSDVPSAGEIFIAHETDKLAKNYAETYQAQNKVRMLEDTKVKMSLDDLFTKIQAGNLKELNIIVKADVQGSVEAVKQSLLKLSNEEVVVKCIHGGVGAINESDVSLASTSSAIIIGFNVRPDVTAKTSAEREGVDIRLYKVIYQAIEDIEAAMKGMLDPVFEEKVLGHAEIRQIFKASAVGNIAGSYILDGIFQRNNKVRISRGGEQIYEGGLASLKRFKDDVKEVKAGFECGFVFDGFDQVQELDVVEAYTMVEVPRS